MRLMNTNMDQQETDLGRRTMNTNMDQQETDLGRRTMNTNMNRQMMMMRRRLNMEMDRQMMMMRRRLNMEMDRQMMMMRRMMDMDMDRQMMRRSRRNFNTIPLGRKLNTSRPPIAGRDMNLNPIPLGFSFCPSDEELLTVYLKNKLLKKPLPPNADAINSLNIYMYGPQDLWYIFKRTGQPTMYFFTYLRLYGVGSSAQTRNAGINGFWKATPGSSEKIYGSKSKTLLGYKKTLVFYQRRPHQANPTKSSWIMEEYKIDLNIIQSESDDPIWTGWVVCKVYNKENDPRKFLADIEAYSLFQPNGCPALPI